jgi:hypothetical protein
MINAIKVRRIDSATLLAIFFLSVFLSCLIVILGCDQGPARPPATDTLGYNSVSSAGIMFRWKVDGANLRVIVVAPTRGWVGVGFAPTVRMQDANIILGYVIGGKAYVSDEFGSGPTLHRPDVFASGTSNVMDAKGREYEGNTEISFAIPLNSGDLRDRPLVPGRSYTVLLAYGPDTADEFTTQHATRTSICVII